ncbi:HNH endonuclease [Arthrobacter phage Jinkies]|uniref:HNH endonuclease n=1 Tax=Arthrobacter phage Jinkies TaxID=2743903 RepID=A0A7S6BFZ0_9CAUD|nr:HNH endonuclease [Arthrobacter phage Jinkies]
MTGDPGPLERIFYPANLTCAVDDCGKPAKSRGKCQVHAMREKRAADRAAGRVTRVAHWATLEERLRYTGWVEVVRRPELGACWEWKGMLDKKGYGRANVGQQKTRAAHRAAYEVWNGELDPDLMVCHSCDNPPCINPAHLFPGDQFVNMGDAKAKRRNANGMRQGCAKLTDQQVAEIRAKYKPREYSQARLGREYGVTQSAIGAIINGRTWKTPTNPPIAA